MKKIVQGYYHFFDHYFEKQKLYQKLFDQQKPIAMFIACCDSRVDPALLVSAQPGDIFVERNVANIVSAPHDGANSILIALEVALLGFGIKDIIVLGHQRCAGVQMLATRRLSNFGAVPAEYQSREYQLLNAGLPAYDDQTASMYEHLNIQLSCQNIIQHQFVAKLIKAKQATVHGWYFSLKTGRLETLCLTCNQFTDLMVECCGKKIC